MHAQLCVQTLLPTVPWPPWPLLQTPSDRASLRPCLTPRRPSAFCRRSQQVTPIGWLCWPAGCLMRGLLAAWLPACVPWLASWLPACLGWLATSFLPRPPHPALPCSANGTTAGSCVWSAALHPRGRRQPAERPARRQQQQRGGGAHRRCRAQRSHAAACGRGRGAGCRPAAATGPPRGRLSCQAAWPAFLPSLFAPLPPPAPSALHPLQPVHQPVRCTYSFKSQHCLPHSSRAHVPPSACMPAEQRLPAWVTLFLPPSFAHAPASWRLWRGVQRVVCSTSKKVSLYHHLAL